MFAKTSTKHTLWNIIYANKKSNARLEAIDHIIETIPNMTPRDKDKK